MAEKLLRGDIWVYTKRLWNSVSWASIRLPASVFLLRFVVYIKTTWWKEVIKLLWVITCNYIRYSFNLLWNINKNSAIFLVFLIKNVKNFISHGYWQLWFQVHHMHIYIFMGGIYSPDTLSRAYNKIKHSELCEYKKIWNKVGVNYFVHK